MDAVALLRLQLEWGADEALGDVPWDRLAPARQLVPASPRPRPPDGVPTRMPDDTPPRVLPVAAASAEAQRLAAAAGTLEALRTALEGFAGCPLRLTASTLVFGDGAAEAGVALIGEAPDAESDRSGRAFAGPSGRMLDAMLGSIDLTRRDVRLLTLTPWRPPGGRAPSESEITACLPFVHRHIALLHPRTLVLLGNAACKWVGGIETGARRARGRWHAVRVPGLDGDVPALALPPPEQVLTQAAAREAAWRELLRLRRTLDGAVPAPK